ncbi:asparagine synthetase A [Thermosphaera chiliense]|uniref:asparagine synthetase A n=1 Tax=Thermosphaera chiliense TaxID=3402707 RepID=UPI001D0BD867|nr:amino acid--tRNA ligase-related protein [Thermosphaera aggregans]
MFYRCGVCGLTPLKEHRTLLAKLSSPEPCPVKLLATVAGKTTESIILRDISGFKELKIKGRVGREILNLPCETSIYVEGFVKGDYLEVEKYRLVHPSKLECCEGESEDVREFALNYFMYAGRPRYFKIIKTMSSLSHLIRNVLVSEGFTELQSPIIGWKSDPGLRGAGRVKVSLYGSQYELHSSLIMYKQIYASIFERIFYFARNIRVEPLENANTGRHLIEFTQVDVEEAFTSMPEAIGFAESLLKRVVREFLNSHGDLLDPPRIEWLDKTFLSEKYPVVTYDEAVNLLARNGFDVRKGSELSHEAEAFLGEYYGIPVWLIGFPSTARGFYYIENAERPGYNVDWNLILPEGHGEILDGGCREYRAEELRRRIQALGENPAEYEWFLNIASKGFVKPSCGWGLGLERLVKAFHGLPHIGFATPHPRLPGIIGP